MSIGSASFTQRVQTAAASTMRSRGVQPLVTSGWVRAVEVQEHAVLAVVEHTCAPVRRDDTLAPFVMPEVPPVGGHGIR